MTTNASSKTMPGERSRRPTRRRTHERLTISLPAEVSAQLKADAKAAGAPSLSAFVAQALAERARKQSFREILADVFRAEPITEEERAWADEILDR